MEKEHVIKASKCVLIISEPELMGCLALKPEVFQRAVGRGKSFRRVTSCVRRQAQVDRWQLYEWLKGNRVPDNAASMIESMNVNELREGCIEYLLTKLRKGGCQY